LSTAKTNAGLSRWLIEPEVGLRPHPHARNDWVDLFSPMLTHLPRASQKRITCVSGLRLRSGSPPALDRHRGCGGQSLGRQKPRRM